MKICKIIFPVYILLAAGGVAAQSNLSESYSGSVVQFSRMNGQVLLDDRYDPAIEGSPFLNTEWAPAELVTGNGMLLSISKAKLNIESNELYYADQAGNTLVIKPGILKKITFSNFNSNENGPYIFRSGYPAIDKQTENYLYQSILEGKIDLLKKSFKIIKTIKDDYNGTFRKEFAEDGKYYVFSEKGMKPLQNNKEFVMALMKDQEPIILQYCVTNKINFKKTDHLQKLFNYYNGLK